MLPIDRIEWLHSELQNMQDAGIDAEWDKIFEIVEDARELAIDPKDPNYHSTKDCPDCRGEGEFYWGGSLNGCYTCDGTGQVRE